MRLPQDPQPRITSCANRGVQMTFPNGWTVSVMWGPGNYCMNQYDRPLAPQHMEDGTIPAYASTDAEVAAWRYEKGKRIWHNFGYDTVSGWLSPLEVVAFMAQVAEGRDLNTTSPWDLLDDDDDAIPQEAS